MNGKFTWWRVNGTDPSNGAAAAMLASLLKSKGACNLASRTEHLDINHLVTQKKFADLQKQLKDDDVLVVCFRNGYCGVRTWLAEIKSEEEFQSLLSLTEKILVERWYAIPKEQFTAITKVARMGTEAIGADPSYC